MLRLSFLPLALALTFLACLSSAHSSPLSERAEKTAQEIQARLHRTVASLKSARTLRAKLSAAENFRRYIGRELEKRQKATWGTQTNRARDSVRNTADDAGDDALALALIGYDEDLGTFLDEPSPDFSPGRCASFRLTLMRCYTENALESAEQRLPAGLPIHTEESLKILDLLCKR